jgi:hypothetical protein
MSAIAAAADRSGGHPLWHLLVVAGGAVGVFVVIKLREQFAADESRHRSPWRSPPTVAVVALALLSAAAAGIHASVSAEHFREAFIFGAFFLAASAAQAGWAVLVIARPSRPVLVVGAAGNAMVIILWTLTRTVGLPVGPEPWRPESIGALDVISTLLELAIVIAAANLVARRTTIPRGRPLADQPAIENPPSTTRV